MVAVQRRQTPRWRTALAVVTIVALLAGVIVGGFIGLRSAARPAFAARGAVIGWEPGVTRGVPLAAPISVYFNRGMDRASVTRAWSLSPAVKGSFHWNTTSVTFQPTVPLVAESSYRLSIGRAAMDDQNQHLRKPFVVSFTAGDVLKAVSETPAPGTSDVPATGLISITFNHPMVEFAGLGAQLKNPRGWHVSMTPRTSGTGTWLDTDMWVFHPSHGLAPSSTYTVTISRRATDAWGLPLGSDVSWTFSTIRPSVIAESPSRGATGADPSAPVSVTFNQPMDVGSTVQAFVLNDGTGSVPGSTSWDGTTLQFQPSVPLDPGRTYTAAVSRSALSATGNIPLSQAVSWTFRVAAPPRVVSSTPSNGDSAAQSYVQIHFSAPMDSASLDQALSISPSLPNMSTYGSGSDYSISGDFQPSTAYTVSLAPGVQDRYGRTMQSGYTLRFTTAPIPAAATLYSPAGIGSGVTVSAGRVGQAPIQLINVPWVHYTLVRTSTGSAAEGYQYGSNLTVPPGTRIRSWTVPVPHPLNAFQNLRVPLANADGSALSPGMYWLGAQGPGIRGAIPSSSELIGVTDAGVTMKVAQHRILVWVASATTGRPLSGETVRLVATNGHAAGTATTDHDGLHMFKVAESYTVQAAVATGKGFGVAMTNWLPNTPNLAEAGQTFGAHGWGPAGRYLYTDRPIYRPGQTVNFRAVLWRNKAGIYSSLGAARVSVSASDGAGHIVYRRFLTLDRFGTVHGSFPLPQGAGTGYGTISVNIAHPATENTVTAFAIAAYRKPEFLTSVSSTRQTYTQGQVIRARVKVAYVFGAPAVGRRVNWTAYSQNRFSQPPGWENYQFGDEGALQQWYADGASVIGDEGVFGSRVAHGTGTTDGSGEMSIRLPVNLTRDPTDQTVTIEATGTDSNHQSVSGRVRLAVVKSVEQIGIAPRTTVVAPGSVARVAVVTVRANGSSLGNAGLAATVYRRTYTSRLGGSGIFGSLWRQVPHDTAVSSQSITTDATGAGSFSFTPDRGGDYYVVVTGQDSLGNTARSAVFIFVRGSGPSNWAFSSDTSLALQPDRPLYRIGQTAKILVAAPFVGATALVTVERGSILSYRVERLGQNSPTVRVPISAADMPNVYVTVTLYRGRIASNPPVWRYGATELRVSVATRKLVIHLAQDRTRYEPGQTATYTVRTTDISGRPVQTEVSLALVDTAVLALQPDTNPDILSGLYGERPLTVVTSSGGAVSIDGLQQSATSRLQPGGAGGGGGGQGPTTVYTRFRDTGYWQAGLLTNRAGRAMIRVTLPDNFTTWRLLARGVSADYQVGQASLRTVSTRAFVLRAVTPRFFVQGDTLRIGAVVNSTVSSPEHVRVSLRSTGLDVAAGTRTVMIPGNRERDVSWRATVPESSRATLRFSVVPITGHGMGYAVHVQIPVYPPLTGETVATSGQVFNSTKQTVIVPPGAAAHPGSLTIQVSSSITSGLGRAYTVFESSIDGSNDDLAARLLAATALRARPRSVTGLPVSGSKLESDAARAVTVLDARQLPDGGWPWYSGTGAGSDPETTADVVMALDGAGRTSVLYRARRYLAGRLHTASPEERAQLLLAIARTGKPDVAGTDAFYHDAIALSHLSPSGLADLAQALRAAGNRVAASSLIARLDSAAVVSSTGTHWDPPVVGEEPPVAETGRCLRALVEIAPNDPFVPAAARWLMLARSGPAWDTDRGAALAISALVAYARHAHEGRASYRYRIAVDGAMALQGDVTPGSTMDESVGRPISSLRRGAPVIISRVDRAGSAGGGPLYYVAQLHYFLPARSITPLSQGVSVNRRYLDFAGHPATAVAAGSIVQVEVVLRTGQSLTHLRVVDPVPAGFEPIDQSLNTSRQGLFKEWQPLVPSPGIKRLTAFLTHVDVRDDRVSLSADSLPAGVYRYTYLVQATVAGTYAAAPTRAWEAFFPEVFGRSAGEVIAVS